jgi:hypothetical protein
MVKAGGAVRRFRRAPVRGGRLVGPEPNRFRLEAIRSFIERIQLHDLFSAYDILNLPDLKGKTASKSSSPQPAGLGE